jgi:hypothetical protein
MPRLVPSSARASHGFDIFGVRHGIREPGLIGDHIKELDHATWAALHSPGRHDARHHRCEDLKTEKAPERSATGGAPDLDPGCHRRKWFADGSLGELQRREQP